MNEFIDLRECIITLGPAALSQLFSFEGVGPLCYFYFGVLHPVARTLSRLLEEPSLATTLEGVCFIFYIFSPLHVSALAGHLQAEYTIILGSYLTHNGSVVLCYRSRLLFGRHCRCLF
jgi:hypothetical protein